MNKESYEIRIKQWRSMIQEANASGMVKRSWCELNGISIKQFYYWKKKVKDYDSSQKLSPSVKESLTTSPSVAEKDKNQPVFCELSASAEPIRLSPLSGQFIQDTSFMPELILGCDRFQLLIGHAITEKTLSTVLSVISHV